MSLKLVLSRRYKVRLKIRIEAFGDIIRNWLNDWWLLVLSLVLLTFGLWAVLRFQLVSVESARWTLSALVQAGAALMGIFYVALGLLWTQANQETERLLELLPGYMREVSPSGTNVRSFINILARAFGTIHDDKYSNTENMIRGCLISLVTLNQASLRFFNERRTRSIVKDIEENFGIKFTDEEQEGIERDNFRISNNVAEFFSYLGRLEDKIEFILKFGRLEFEYIFEGKRSDFYTNVLHTARRIDRVYVSLWKLRFIDYFRGKGIVIISTLWLTSLTFGLLILFAVDKIAINLLPYIASVPIGLGIIAIGTTLSFGFRAMSAKE